MCVNVNGYKCRTQDSHYSAIYNIPSIRNLTADSCSNCSESRIVVNPTVEQITGKAIYTFQAGSDAGALGVFAEIGAVVGDD